MPNGEFEVSLGAVHTEFDVSDWFFAYQNGFGESGIRPDLGDTLFPGFDLRIFEVEYDEFGVPTGDSIQTHGETSDDIPFPTGQASFWGHAAQELLSDGSDLSYLQSQQYGNMYGDGVFWDYSGGDFRSAWVELDPVGDALPADATQVSLSVSMRVRYTQITPFSTPEAAFGIDFFIPEATAMTKPWFGEATEVNGPDVTVIGEYPQNHAMMFTRFVQDMEDGEWATINVPLNDLTAEPIDWLNEEPESERFQRALTAFRDGTMRACITIDSHDGDGTFDIGEITVTGSWYYPPPGPGRVGVPGTYNKVFYTASMNSDDLSGAMIHRHNADGTWTDITTNLEEVVANGEEINGWQITDLRGRYVLFLVTEIHETGDLLRTGCAWFDGTEWMPMFREDFAGSEGMGFYGFFEWNGELYVHGTIGLEDFYGGGGQYSIWSVDPGVGDVDLLARDSGSALDFQHSWRHCVVQNPFDSSEVIVTDMDTDLFGTWTPAGGFVPRGGNPDGSCIFALGLDDQGVLWSGNADNVYWWTRDGHAWDTLDEFQFEGIYPEAWCADTWQGKLHMVGTIPPAIIRRTDEPPEAGLEDAWDFVLNDVINVETSQDVGYGVGFQAMHPFVDRMVLGWGGEPFYNVNTDWEGQCLTWDGTTLHDIGVGVNFGAGLYLISVEEEGVPPLRLFQRDDANGLPSRGSSSIRMIGPGAGPQPTSLQAGTRISHNLNREYR